MRVQLSILLLVALVALVSAEQDAVAKEERGAIRRNFGMPKLFSMEVFMEKFQKNYPNAAELMRRTKLFMARAFTVFISGIKYMYGKSPMYLRVNPRSDWTKAERDATLNYEGKRPGPKQLDDKPEPAVEPEDVQKIIEDPDVEKMAAELEVDEHHRSKRDAQPSKKRKLTVDQLMGGGQQMPAEMSPKYVSHIESNNPDYEEPEMFSEGVDDDAQPESLNQISDNEAEKIDLVASTGSYLGYLFNGKKQGSSPSENRNSWGTKLKLLINGVQEEEEELFVDNREPGTTRDSSDQLFLDYRASGCMLPAKNQGRCGSCYIFAQNSIIEWHHCNQTGKLVPFSEQYAIDCGPGKGIDYLSGCQGGVETFVGDFYDRYGLELAVDYPYRAKEQKCPYDAARLKPEHMGHTRMDIIENVVIVNHGDLTPSEITHLLEVKGPLTISIIIEDHFHDFGGGVDPNNCDLGAPGGHAMAIVGHGIEDGVEYFLIRNSHGQDYGLGGYYKMAKSGKRGCIIRIGYTRAQFAENSDHKGKAILRRRNRLINRLLHFY